MEHCGRFLDLMTQSLDGPLALEDHQALEQHLEQCPECRLLSQQLLEIRDELHSWQEQEVPEGFAEGVMSRIRAEEKKPKIVPIWKHPQFKMFGSVAACAMICLGLWRANAPQVIENASLPGETAAPAAETQMIYTTSTPAAEIENTESKLAQAPAAAGAPMLQDEQNSVRFYDLYNADNEEDLIQLVQDTLGEVPGAILVVDRIPDTLDGTWHTTKGGTILLVLNAHQDEEMWKTYADSAVFHVELGNGPIVFIQAK